jgi:deoxyribose-phosphate aldolase
MQPLEPMDITFQPILKIAEAYDHELPPRAEMAVISSSSLASVIDHTLLKPEATPEQVQKLCEEAAQYRFASVCVNPIYVPQAFQALNRTPVKICAVVGFPLGATPTNLKAEETRYCIEAGAREIDMVIPVGMLKAGEYERVFDDIRGVVAVSHNSGALLKVILEMCLLTRSEKIIGCLLSQRAGADFVKTSTGFSAAGATIDDVDLMRRVVGPQMGVKAAGGIRSLDDALNMLKAGATRLGSSSGVKIIQEGLARENRANL